MAAASILVDVCFGEDLLSDVSIKRSAGWSNHSRKIRVPATSIPDFQCFKMSEQPRSPKIEDAMHQSIHY